jgi:hypothetical protein
MVSDGIFRNMQRNLDVVKKRDSIPHYQKAITEILKIITALNSGSPLLSILIVEYLTETELGAVNKVPPSKEFNKLVRLVSVLSEKQRQAFWSYFRIIIEKGELNGLLKSDTRLRLLTSLFERIPFNAPDSEQS